MDNKDIKMNVQHFAKNWVFGHNVSNLNAFFEYCSKFLLRLNSYRLPEFLKKWTTLDVTNPKALINIKSRTI